MPDPTLFYLIRHAEPEMGENGRICLGRKLDVPLSEYGKKQALLLGEQLKDKHFDFIFTSPLLRARETADALQQDCPRMIATELTEVDGGEWDGMLFSTIQKTAEARHRLAVKVTKKSWKEAWHFWKH